VNYKTESLNAKQTCQADLNAFTIGTPLYPAPNQYLPSYPQQMFHQQMVQVPISTANILALSYSAIAAIGAYGGDHGTGADVKVETSQAHSISSAKGLTIINCE